MSFLKVNEELTKLNMSHHLKKFQEAEIDDELLPLATEENFKELGLSIGERIKLVRHLNNLKSTSTQVTSEINLQKIEDHLVKFYEHEDRTHFRRMDKTKLSLDACYVNLAVVPMDIYNVLETREHKTFESDFIRPRSSEELISDKSNIIKLRNLFDQDDKNASTKFESNWENVNQKRILIFGRAGVGKTTLCKKIVYSYYKEDIWKDYFHRVVWLTLRDFKQIGKPEGKFHTELSDVYAQQFILNNKDGEILSGIIKAEEDDGKKILYILDGWDEIQELLVINGHMRNVLLEELLKKPFLILTSRPYTMELESSYFDQVLETVGFTKKNIFRYIENVIPEDIPHQNKVLNFINSHSVISGIASIPIQLDMLCYLCSNIDDVEECLHTETVTMTKLYDVLVKKMLDMNKLREGQPNTFEWISYDYKNAFSKFKNGESCQDISQVFFLAEIAYNGLLGNQIEFNDKFFSNAKSYSLEIRNKMKNSYFLNCLNPSEAIEKKSYTFIHLTFQEFMAALYIANHLEQDKVLEVISTNKYNPRFQIVWSFVAGLIDNSQDLNIFFNYLERSPIDITGIPHQLLMLNCINECGDFMEQRRMDRILEDLWNWLKSENWHLADTQLPKKLYENMLTSIFTLDTQTVTVSELFLGYTKWLPDSIILELIDKLFQVENPNPAVIKSVQKILSCKYRFISVKVAERIESFLREEIDKSKRRKESLLRCEFLINLLPGCILKDSTCNTLLELFDAMLEEFERPVSRYVHVAITTVLGNGNSIFKDKLLEKIFDMLHVNKVPRIRKRSLYCLWRIKKLSFPTQNTLVDYFGTISMELLNECFQKQKNLSPYVIEKMIHHVTKSQVQMDKIRALRVLGTRKNLNEEMFQEIFSVFSRGNPQLKKSILFAFGHQNEIFDSIANQILEEFVTQGQENTACPYFRALCVVLQNPKISQHVLDKLGDLFNKYHRENNSELVIQVLNILKFKTFPDNITDNLYSRMKGSVDCISELKDILGCLEYQCIFCNEADFPIFLTKMVMKDEMLIKPIVNIFKQHQHLFLIDNVIAQIGNIVSDQSNLNSKNVIQVLAHYKNVPQDILFIVVRRLINPTQLSSEEPQRYADIKILRILIRNQSKLPENLLPYLFNVNNWKSVDYFGKYVSRLVHHLPLEEILVNLSESNWKNVFDNIIVNRMKASYFPIPVIQITEDKKALSIFTPLSKKPKEIKDLELWHVVKTLKNVENLPLRPDFLTLYLMFHTKQESLRYIDNIPITFQHLIGNVVVNANYLGKYLRLHLNTNEPMEEDFKILFKEIKNQLKYEDVRHIDLRNNYLNDSRIQELKDCILNSGKNISTLILSDQQITCGDDGLRSLMDSSFCKKIGLKYLYLNRNHIYLEKDDFSATLSDETSLLRRSGLEILDLSGNFIPEGKLFTIKRNAGNIQDYIEENVVAEKSFLLSSGISEVDLERNVIFIKNSPIVNSSDVDKNSLGFIPVCTSFYKLKSDLKESERRVSKSLGCIVLGHKKQGISKHAFFGIDWVPPRQSEGYGQRQLIKSDLVLSGGSDGHINIRIFQMPPQKFIQKFTDTKVKVKSVIFVPTEKICECLNWIYTSRDIADKYSYKLLASLKSSKYDKLNCHTWTDIMLEKCGIKIDSMKENYPILSRLPLSTHFVSSSS